MKWVDYREKLGIGFSSEAKFSMLKNKIIIFISSIFEYDDDAYQKYAIMVGEELLNCANPAIWGLEKSFEKISNCKELIAKYIAFYNTYPSGQLGFSYAYSEYTEKSAVLAFIKLALADLNIQYELIKDKDGIFIFTKGAKELDDALVSTPLEWLKDYPDSRKVFMKALKNYSEVIDSTASDVADNFRKALECFFQEFFGGGRSLENYKSIYGEYLKRQGIPKEISGNLETLFQAYTNYNNNYAKHRDKASDIVLEYVLYQTGNIIRLLITLRQE